MHSPRMRLLPRLRPAFISFCDLFHAFYGQTGPAHKRQCFALFLATSAAHLQATVFFLLANCEHDSHINSSGVIFDSANLQRGCAVWP